MKALVALLLGVIAVLLLRSTALAALAARGVILDALALATVLWALRHGASWGSSFGFVLGLAADLDSAHWIGRHALSLTLIGYAVGRLASTVVRESARTQFALLCAATLSHQAWVVLFELGGWERWSYALVRMVAACLATAVAGTVFLIGARRLIGRPLFGNVSVQPGKSI